MEKFKYMSSRPHTWVFRIHANRFGGDVKPIGLEHNPSNQCVIIIIKYAEQYGFDCPLKFFP